MKIRRALIAALAMASLPLATAAAGDQAAIAADGARAIGQQASQTLQKQLGSALMQALGEGGPVAAVAVCADTAQVLTARIARDLGVPGLQLKRTSLRLRNPENQPDALEAAVLEAFTADLVSGESVEPRLERTDGGFRYFAPIQTKGFCLQCHGEQERLAGGVPAILAERYPDDGAIGHEKGDLRGIVSVTIPGDAAGP